jgi:hypothetical protein
MQNQKNGYAFCHKKTKICIIMPIYYINRCNNRYHTRISALSYERHKHNQIVVLNNIKWIRMWKQIQKNIIFVNHLAKHKRRNWKFSKKLWIWLSDDNHICTANEICVRDERCHTHQSLINNYFIPFYKHKIPKTCILHKSSSISNKYSKFFY